MYSGFLSDRHVIQWIGVHQKFNRVAHRLFSERISDKLGFPAIKQIQNFEGMNGPDGIKMKSPGQHEPWHYYDPLDDTDTQLIELLEEHYEMLVKNLREQNLERAAFEASWMAHGITDGLTPAHQYPYERELEEITGKDKENRTSKSQKVIARSSSKTQFLRNNWRLWGNKGLFITHVSFEMGVATIAIPMRTKKLTITQHEIDLAKKLGLAELFKRSARTIASYHMYDRFYRSGWTTSLGRDVREVLVPVTSKTVALSWYLAYEEAAKKK